MADRLIVESKVREALKKLDDEARVSDEFLDSLSERIAQKLKRALLRAKDNGRKTLRPWDL